MSKIAARFDKVKSGNISGFGKHIDRESKNHSNPDIDTTKSHLNYELIERQNSIQHDVLNYIETEKTTTRAIRKDAVICNAWIITSNKDFFDKLNPDETKAFFEASLDYFKKEFGENNVRYATVHMDERTPHMHMGVVPFDKDNKLSSKRVLTRQKLIEIQEDLPKYLQEKGFDIERGERNSQAKHKSVTELKIQTAKEVQELAQERGIIQSGVSHYSQELHEISEQVEEKQALVENLENKVEKLQFEVSDWQRNINTLEEEKNALEVKIEPLQHKVDHLENLHEEIETELGILEARKNGTKREFEAVLDDIQDFQAFNDLVGHMEPKEWRSKLTSDILLRYDRTPIDLEQAERWKSYLVDGQNYIPKTFEQALSVINKAIEKLLSKVHQQFRTIKKSVGLGKQTEPHEEQSRVLNNRLDKLLKESSQEKEKSLRSKNKDGLER